MIGLKNTHQRPPIFVITNKKLRVDPSAAAPITVWMLDETLCEKTHFSQFLKKQLNHLLASSWIQ